MLSADVFVLASRRESFGLVLIEARQAGCAIVASDIDGISEALDGGRAGLLVPPQNVQALAHALCKLLANDHERHMWQRRALQGIETFQVSAMAREVENVYHELIRKKYWKAIPEAALPE
jgi:glycosyltransferase involved in cell wall biosynthesis